MPAGGDLAGGELAGGKLAGGKLAGARLTGAQPALTLAPQLQPAVASGHPWIYRDHLPRHALVDGQVVKVTAGTAAAYGIYSATGAIGVRLYGTTAPDRALIEQRVADAVALRAELMSDGTDCYRLLNGEGDRLPGVVVDRYGRYAVLKRYSSGLDEVTAVVAKELGTRLKLRGVVERSAAESGRGGERGERSLVALWGEPPPPRLTVRENGLDFEVDLWRGQKSGAFLDQRENRSLVREHSAGRRVLNLFAYTGGFSVYALAGGAAHVTSVDLAEPALDTIAPTLAANALPAARHSAVVADVFENLPHWAAAAAAAATNAGDLPAGGEPDGGSENEVSGRYDLVIVDPPSLANNAEQRRRAQRAYLRLNRDALRLVTPGGLLATASCTAQVSPEAFKQALADAALAAGVSAQVVAERGHAVDHPVPLAFPEGRYLKFVLLRVLAT
ncbi:MAG TPA: class I SAM-dependent rRNA methyltransferase [Trueperaceae bacterium]|nr:class I SAM-dependent rRNA methyltransferase [Trueperaceae bacterium]